jgi:hypothetical protein
MTSWQHVQRSFSGGEISGRMLMRADTEVYKRAAIEMVNFMPTPQGSAKRMPGTRFYQEIDDLDARIIPFLTSGNERSLLILTPENLLLIRNVADRLNADYANIEIDGSTILFRRNIVRNFAFRQGEIGWTLSPEQYFGVNGDGPLGAYVEQLENGGGNLVLRPRLYRYPAQEAEVVTAEATAEVDVETDTITIDYEAIFANQPGVVADGGYTFTVTVSANSDYSSPLLEESYNEVSHPNPGTQFTFDGNVSLPTTAWTGTLYIKFTAEATATTAQPYSNPLIKVRYFRIWANGETELEEADVSTSYTAADLEDIHYVQSPYKDKELVLTHPKHQPSKFFFNTSGSGAYQFTAISFSPSAPSVWDVNNYPASCTSFLGRLVLAGGQTFKTATGDPVATASETVWATDVGAWDTFTAGTNPDDSLEFTAIYRSPIQWVYGQRSLLVGSLEYEYSVRGEGILAPGDLGVFLQSTHGSANVQPAGFGEAVLFPADGGTKVRSLAYIRETDGWVAEDLTLLNPSICYPGIKRMVRLRNPHQMCVVLKKDGTIATYHSESGLSGWSRYKLEGGLIRDICVVPDNEGLDVLFLTVERVIDGERKLYLECIPDWRESERWDYTQSTIRLNFETPTDTITGLDHLEGKTVQVWSPARYIGFYRVVNGQITLTIGTGFESSGDITVEVTQCSIGLGHRCYLKTLPPEKVDPGAQARYVDFSVRILGSTRPIVNGERPADRNPTTVMDLSQPLDLINDVSIAKFGWDPYQVITIEEQLPFPCEILGVYGKVKQGQTP